MSEFRTFDDKTVAVGKCLGCFIVNNFEDSDRISGQIFKTKNFTVAQDFELPINGFVVISSNRHLLSINEMTREEKIELITLIDIVVACLKKLNVCPEYDVVWEEKSGCHFHVWLMPRHRYLLDAIGSNIMKNVGQTFNYAKNNLRTVKNLKKIFKTIQGLKQELESNPEIQKLL